MKEGYKKTELGWIPNEWKVGKFEDILVPRKETFNPKIEGNEIYVGLEHIEEATGRLICTGNSSDTSSIKNKFYNGDILFGKLRPYLRKYHMTDFSGVCVTEILVLTEKKSNNKFCYYNLQQDNFIEYINSKTFGTKMPRTSWNDIKEYPICIPPLKEQQKIAEILSTVDSQIDGAHKIIKKTKELKKGLMQRLLTRGIGHTELKKTEIGEIPVEWEVKRFSDISKINQGLQIAIEERFKEVAENRLPYITIQYINDKSNIDNQFYIDNANSSVVCYEEDILMTRTGNTGVVVTNEYGVFHNNFFKVDFNREVLIKDFLVYYLKSTQIQKLILNYAGSTTIPDLKHKDFYRIPVIIPSIEEQKHIADILISVDNEIKYYENKKTKLEEIKKGLMQQLLTGKIRVV